MEAAAKAAQAWAAAATLAFVIGQRCSCYAGGGGAGADAAAAAGPGPGAHRWTQAVGQCRQVLQACRLASCSLPALRNLPRGSRTPRCTPLAGRPRSRRCTRAVSAFGIQEGWPLSASTHRCALCIDVLRQFSTVLPTGILVIWIQALALASEPSRHRPAMVEHSLRFVCLRDACTVVDTGIWISEWKTGMSMRTGMFKWRAVYQEHFVRVPYCANRCWFERPASCLRRRRSMGSPTSLTRWGCRGKRATPNPPEGKHLGRLELCRLRAVGRS